MRQGRDPVKFSQPTFVDPPKRLTGDSGDGRCPDSSEVCFKNVDDLLFGRTHLLRSDDLVLGYQGAFGLFPSQNSTLTESKLFSLNDGSNNYPAVVGARLFNTGSDVAVTLVKGQDNISMQWRLDSNAGMVASGTVALPPSSGPFLSAFAGDFTGDGFDEIVVFNIDVVQSAIVGTAVNPQNPSQGLKFGPALRTFNLNSAPQSPRLLFWPAACIRGSFSPL